MLTFNFYHDTRRKNETGLYPVRFTIACKSNKVVIATGYRLSVEDYASIKSGQVKTPALIRIKNNLDRMRLDAEDMVVVLTSQGQPVTPTTLKTALLEKADPSLKEKREKKEAAEQSLVTWFRRRMELKSGKTLDSIKLTLAKIEAFAPKVKLDELTPAWLQRFDAYMAQTSPSSNARAVHMRNLRAVINFAIDENATNNYPFRRFHIKTVKTAKRSLSVEELRAFFNAPADETERRYLDMFKLMFCLIGINSVDLLHLKHTDMRGGRIIYNRSKTKRLYSIKVEPEALELIERLKGIDHLLYPLDNVGNWEHYRRRINKALSGIGNTTVGKHGKKIKEPMYPQITTYWARHTWATIAASLDIPKDTIAAALGHGGNSVTDIYIDFDLRKVDAANRKVLDWVLYGKR